MAPETAVADLNTVRSKLHHEALGQEGVSGYGEKAKAREAFTKKPSTCSTMSISNEEL